MHLREYLFHKRITYKVFAENVQCNRDYINKIALRKRKPGKHLAKIIEEATNGEVTVKELLSDEN